MPQAQRLEGLAAAMGAERHSHWELTLEQPLADEHRWTLEQIGADTSVTKRCVLKRNDGELS